MCRIIEVQIIWNRGTADNWGKQYGTFVETKPLPSIMKSVWT